MHEVPAAIEELQLWMASIVTRPFRETAEFNLPVYPTFLVKEIREKITPGPSLSPEERLGLFNQQYWWRFFVLLQQAFPTLSRLFGYRDFNTSIAEPYLLRYPTNDWFLPNLGKDLVKWLQEEYHEGDRELILQAAMLDAAYEQLMHVEEKPIAVDIDKKLFLQPTVALFSFSADFHSFRAKLLEQDVAYWQTADWPRLDNSRGYYCLLYRAKEGIAYEELTESQYQLLSAFCEGARVDSASLDWFKRGFFTQRRNDETIER